MPYRPDLDGIRALAVLAVMASHTGVPIASGGWMGVDVFFVLSGYLITTLLAAEHASTGRISLSRFYARRGLRLYPALLVVLVIGVIFFPELGAGGTFTGYVRAAAVAGLYVEDFFYGIGHHAVGGFGHTWSLAVEEQFYLLWPPLLVWVVRRGRDPLTWALAGATLAWIVGGIYAFHPSSDGFPYGSYYLPWCRFSQILAGCALALMIERGARAPRFLRSLSGGLAAGFGLALLVLAASRFGRTEHLAWEAPVCAVLTCALVWHLVAAPATGALRRVLGVAPLAWIGRRSYGLYLFHLPVLEVLAAHLHVRRLELVVAMVVVTFVLAALSYRLIELPALRFKRRFQPAL